MVDRRGHDELAPGARARTRSRRAARRRRALRGLVRTVVWLVVLGVTFTFGMGVGRTVAEDSAPARELVTLEEDRGVVTATLPTTTVERTETVTVTARRGGTGGGRGSGNGSGGGGAPG